MSHARTLAWLTTLILAIGASIATPQVGEPEACCLPDGGCVERIPSVCGDIGGSPSALGKGSGTPCLDDGNGDDIDDACFCPCDGDPDGDGLIAT